MNTKEWKNREYTKPVFDNNEKPPLQSPIDFSKPRRKDIEKSKEEETPGAGGKDLIPIV